MIGLRFVVAEQVGNPNAITLCHSAEMINSDRRHHRLASSRYTRTEERLVGSLQPSPELRTVYKPLSGPFLPPTDDIVLLGGKVCRR